MALTEKQVTFARALAAGIPQKEAYIQAYDTKSMNPNTLAVNACKEANKPEVKAYVEQCIKTEQDYVGIMQTRDDAYIRTLILRRIQACEARGDDTALARYADMLNKLNGSYVNITKDVTERDTKLDSMSVDELKALLNGK